MSDYYGTDAADDGPPPPPGSPPAAAPPASAPTVPTSAGGVDLGPPSDHEARRLASGDPGNEVVRRATLHQTEQTRTYPCTSCGGDLEFDISQQNLTCPHCGNSQDIVEDAGKVVAEQDFRSALQALNSGALSRTVASGTSQEKEVVCQNCGGHTTFVGSLAATRCPYCATPIQRDDVHDAPTRLAVDGVLPFQVDDATAKKVIDEWIKSRWFAPGEFKKYSTSGSFASVYAAYYTYDALCESDYRGQRGDTYTVTVGSGDNRRTETRVRWTPRWGHVTDRFDDITVLANTGLERKFVDRLEPWPTQSAKPFSAEYLAGHLCRTYDNDVEHGFVAAKARMDDAIKQTVRGDIGGDQQRIQHVNTQYHNLTYKYLLLPIWLLTVIYAGQTFQVFINGVTAEVHGERPYSKLKIAITALLVLAAIAVGVLLSRR